MTRADETGLPPGAWPSVRRVVRTVTRPVEAFLATEVAGGAVLLAATATALAWANSPWAASYHALWETPVGVRLGEHALETTLHFVVNEVLMTFFFFVVGLEIRREIARGELSEPRRAALPLAAALGGMVVPALVFLALNAGRATAAGWGVPMATDIAFAIGVLTLLGDRVAPGLRILLLALAVIDDVGAILVIGVFYSSGFQIAGVGVAALGAVAIALMQATGARRAIAYALPAAAVWIGLHEAGIHATLAGVVVGLMTPTTAWFRHAELVKVVERVVSAVSRREHASGAHAAHHDDHELASRLDALAQARREVMAPVDLLQYRFHKPVAFFVMPLFAFANAGVSVGRMDVSGDTVPLVLGIGLGLVVGKLVGIAGGTWLVVRAGLAPLPRGVTWSGVLTVAAVGGIGFTMSLFVAELAFSREVLEAAKLAVLAGSLVAAIVGLVLGRVVLPRRAPELRGARTDSEAESSTVD